MTTPTMKTCTKCGETKPLDGFYPSKIRKPGSVAQCKLCCSERERRYREVHREEVLARKRAYYANNREEVCSRVRAYREVHREEALARQRAYREEHRDECRARDRARRLLVGFDYKAPEIAARYATHSGPWSAEEDSYLIGSTEPVLDIALALKRTYYAVASRRDLLRSRGVVLACDTPETSTPVLVKEAA